jgi:nitroreductase
MNKNEQRHTQAKVDSLFPDRWSPRSFNPDYELKDEDLRSLIEAARWAPSCFNEQPWKIHVAKRGTKAFETFLACLVESNRKWAKNSSLIGFFMGSKNFSKNGKPNSTYEYDCGSAWMSLTLQARKLGLYTHGMAGVEYDKISEVLKIQNGQERVIAAFAVGQKDSPEKLPEDLKNKEVLSDRKKLDEVFVLHKELSLPN